MPVSARDADRSARAGIVRYTGIAGALVLLTLGEARIFDRLLYEDRGEYEFVLESVRGVLAGTPVSKSWSHRLFAPLLVRALEQITSSPLAALQTFSHVALLAINVLLFVLIRRRGETVPRALAVVATFGFVRCLLMYRLEYPWDEVDILLFAAFGSLAALRRPLGSASSLLAIGTVNHETIFYIPLWYLLSPIDSRSPRRSALADVVAGSAATALAAAAVYALRRWMYVGRPHLPGQAFERSLPVVENHLHVGHNLRQLFYDDWVHGRTFVAAALLVAIALLCRLAVRGGHRRAAVWSLIVIGTIVAFGYVNETRHYFVLAAFWTTYSVGLFGPDRAG
jgi:hypothetical protein